MHKFQLTGVSPYFILYLVMMFVYSIALTMIQTATTTIIQEKAENSMQGRVFGLMGAMYRDSFLLEWQSLVHLQMFYHCSGLCLVAVLLLFY